MTHQFSFALPDGREEDLLLRVGDQATVRDICSQFHQQITSSFYADILLPKNYKAKL
jgi:hypothetical protein